MIQISIALILALLIPAATMAQASPAAAPAAAAIPAAPKDDVERLRIDGFNAVFSLDYAKAGKDFDEIIRIAPDLPQGYLYRATNTWLKALYDKRLLSTSLYTKDEFFEQKERAIDPAIDKAFRKDLAEAIRLAQVRVKARPNDVEALYFLGAAHGTLGGYEASMARAFMAALDHGREAVELHERVLKLDPKFADALMTVGMYHYVVGSLNFLVKSIAVLGGIRGSKKQGIAELERVTKEGNRSADDARVILLSLYSREKRLDESLEILRNLKAKYPANYVLSLEEANTLVKLKRYDEAFANFDALMAMQRVGSEAKDFVAYAYGEALKQAGAYQKAIPMYAQVWTWRGADSDLVTLARLGAGQCHDALGQRADALAQYKMVIRRADILDSVRRATDYTKKPYSPSSPIASTGHEIIAS